MKSMNLWWIASVNRVRSLARVGRVSLFVFLTCVFSAASASAAPFVYVVTLFQQFGTVDLANGRFQPIGNGTPDSLSDLVWNKDGSLLTLATFPNMGYLAKINPATGEETLIGPTGLSYNAFSLAEVRGKLYLTDLSNNLYSVNPATGAATPLAKTGMPPDQHVPLTFGNYYTYFLCDEGFYGIAGKLYATFDSFAIDPTQGPPPPRTEEYNSPRLYAIDPFTGETTVLGNIDWSLSAIVEANGKGYAFKGVLDGFIYTSSDPLAGFPIAHPELDTFDWKTGKTKKIADMDPGVGVIFGAAPLPDPNSSY